MGASKDKEKPGTVDPCVGRLRAWRERSARCGARTARQEADQGPATRPSIARPRSTCTMKHVADGGLPAHLEDQRTRMFVRTDAPAHTATVESAGAFAACGLENSFSIERFRKDFRAVVKSLNDEEIVFDLIGIDAALANAFRRILLAEVPTMAIEKVFILNNTSMIQDEVLAQRLGLIPIRADPRKFNARHADEDADADNVISFRLQVKCKQRSGSAAGTPGTPGVPGSAGAGSSSGGGGDVTGASVTSADLEWIAQGDQDERFADDPIRPVHDDILIARLRPGQEIELEAWCEKGLGKTHAKWSPVCTASYRLLPEIRVTPPRAGAAADDDDAPPDRGVKSARARRRHRARCAHCTCAPRDAMRVRACARATRLTGGVGARVCHSQASSTRPHPTRRSTRARVRARSGRRRAGARRRARRAGTSACSSLASKTISSSRWRAPARSHPRSSSARPSRCSCKSRSTSRRSCAMQ